MWQRSNTFQTVRGLLVATWILLVAFVAGCAPRGETASVDEVLQSARDRFAAVNSADSSAQLSAASRKALDEAVQAVEGLLSAAAPAEQAAKARSVEQSLRQLLPHAGYTSRPAMSEVLQQYGQLAQALGTTELPDVSTLKLAASRAYMVITSELETTKFAL